MDDDTYVNVKELLNLLKGYDPLEDWYIGKPSLSHPIEMIVKEVIFPLFHQPHICSKTILNIAAIDRNSIVITVHI